MNRATLNSKSARKSSGAQQPGRVEVGAQHNAVGDPLLFDFLECPLCRSVRGEAGRCERNLGKEGAQGKQMGTVEDAGVATL